VDGRFVHVLTPNIYRTLAEALQTFDYITKTGNFGFVDREVARWSGVAIMVRVHASGAPCDGTQSRCAPRADPRPLRRPQYTLSKMKLKKRHNIVDERKSLYEEVRARRVGGAAALPLPPARTALMPASSMRPRSTGWEVDRRAGHAQVHGRRPAQPGWCAPVPVWAAWRVRCAGNPEVHALTSVARAALAAADIAFFGVLRAVHGFDTFNDVMANTTLQPWCAPQADANARNTSIPRPRAAA
jgi:hypothetical protein